MDFAIKTNQYSICYEDETGDQINISDDEDLQAAYDLSESTPTKQLKLKINPRDGIDLSKKVYNPIENKEKI